MRSWEEEEIGRLIAARTEAADLDPDFTRLVLPRQLDDRTYESLAARNQAGFVRVLWHACGGNPAMALQLWSDSLFMEGDQVVVRLFQPPGAGDLDGLGPDAFFVLRTLLRLESASSQDLADCLPVDPQAVEDTLQLARSKGMLDECDGQMSLSPRWHRAVMTALSRRNMVA